MTPALANYQGLNTPVAATVEKAIAKVICISIMVSVWLLWFIKLTTTMIAKSFS